MFNDRKAQNLYFYIVKIYCKYLVQNQSEFPFKDY
jgi:hypothetical protein